MTDSDSPAPKPFRRTWRLLALVVTGVAAPLALAVSGHAAAGALIGAAIVGVIGAFVAWDDMTGAAEGAAPPLRSIDAALSTPQSGAMLDLLDDPILVIEGGERENLGERRFVFANRAARDALRIARPEGPLTTAVRTPEVLDVVDDALYDGKRSEVAYEVRGVQDRSWRATAAPLSEGENRPPFALLVLHDETEIRRSERARSNFLANASHELRTPLASLAGFIETLRGHARDDPAARDQFLGIMHSQAERMRRLIDDLMSLSRIELGEHIPPSGTVDMALAVIDILDALDPLAKDRHVTFDLALPPLGAVLAAADRDQILQVVQNLVENAVKYTPVGGRVVVEVLDDLTPVAAAATVLEKAAHFSILTPDHAVGRRYVGVRVRDFGPGVDRSHLPRLSERFYRVEGQKARERPGTGLGLAIVKHIVNRHRGGLIVESAPGAGAVFTAYVPAAHPATEAAATEAA
jgi:two-component system phosphate regulon sensor histidine kinase PhoR